MRYSDIPQLTRSANYVVNIPWDHLEGALAKYNENGDLELDPEFQRAHVWTEDKQIRYVEFIMRGGKSSRDIYFNHRGWFKDWKGPMYLVDGKQRLEAVRKFMRNELPVFDGHFKKDFEDKVPTMRYDFIFHVNDLQTYEEVLTWYLDLNSGGVVHKESELNKVRLLLEQEQTKRTWPKQDGKYIEERS